MAIVKRIALFSALKIGFVVHALLGLLFGLICTSIALAGIPFGPHAHMPSHDAFAALPLVLCPLFYGIIGSIATVLGALFYNLASGFVGGLEIDIK